MRVKAIIVGQRTFESALGSEKAGHVAYRGRRLRLLPVMLLQLWPLTLLLVGELLLLLLPPRPRPSPLLLLLVVQFLSLILPLWQP